MDDFTGKFCGNGPYPLIKNSMSLLPEFIPLEYIPKHEHNKRKNLSTSNKTLGVDYKKRNSVYFLKDFSNLTMSPSKEETLKYRQIRSDLLAFLANYPNSFMTLNSTSH